MTSQIRPPVIPAAPKSIQKGSSLADLLGEQAIECLALNIKYVYGDFDTHEFTNTAFDGIEPLGLMQRGKHIAHALRKHLPSIYAQSVDILMLSLTPRLLEANEFGLEGFFYLPHSFFISEFGIDPANNNGEDPFPLSMNAMYELTLRATSEFSIREFLINDLERSLEFIMPWLDDPNPHVRRLCSEGTRPKLPWGKRIKALIQNPEPALPILNKLKDDESLYVRRSVANHLGDIAKDHPQLVFDLCRDWLSSGATKELKWLIRHAVRYHAKKGCTDALEIRKLAA